MEQNIKIKNLLKKVLENREFVYSYDDSAWDIVTDDGFDNVIYTFEYHLEVRTVLGKGSTAVADVHVIIDKILMNDEDFYYDWVESNYSENAWYIDKLHDHLNNEFFNVFPFSIYPTFYGHDEER